MEIVLTFAVLAYTSLVTYLCWVILCYCWDLPHKIGPWAYVCHFMKFVLYALTTSALGFAVSVVYLASVTDSILKFVLLLAVIIAYCNLGANVVESMMEYHITSSKESDLISVYDYFNHRNRYCFSSGNIGIRNQDSTIALVRPRHPLIFGCLFWLESIFEKYV